MDASSFFHKENTALLQLQLRTSCVWWAVDIYINFSSLKKKFPPFFTPLSHIGNLFTLCGSFSRKNVSFLCFIHLFSSVQFGSFFHPVPTFWLFSYVMFIVCITSSMKIYFSHKTSTDKFYIRGSVHHDSRLKRSDKMQQYAGTYLLLNYSTCFGLHHAHHQEYIKL